MTKIIPINAIPEKINAYFIALVKKRAEKAKIGITTLANAKK